MASWVPVAIGALGVVVLALCGVMGWLVSNLLALQRALRQAHRQLQDQAKDMGGLCAAGITQDQRQRGVEERLTRCEQALEKVGTQRSVDRATQPYEAAIERARQGADAAELCELFGLSREEAGLLVRLHGAAQARYAERDAAGFN